MCESNLSRPRPSARASSRSNGADNDNWEAPAALRAAALSAGPSNVVTVHNEEAPATLRRSSRSRKQTKLFQPLLDDVDAAPARRQRSTASASAAANASAIVDDEEEEQHDLDQIALVDGGTLRMRVHPCAAALMHFHVHLSRTEVIGYLGGFVLGDGLVDVAEAFPAICVGSREMARSGRSALREVEMQPESDVMLRARIASKGLQVVGWYHSHPDARFTTDPSRVDIENQANYQQYIFRDQPFVAAVLAPYNDELPDAVGDMDAFYVAGDRLTPLRVPFTVDYAINDRQMRAEYAEYRTHLGDRLLPDEALETEVVPLVLDLAKYRQRVHLLNVWRDGMSNADKLRECLISLLPKPETHENGGENSANTASNANTTRAANVRLTELIHQFLELIKTTWPPAPTRKAGGGRKRKRKKGY